MNTAKQIQTNESLSENDLRLKRYLELDQSIKAMTKELEQLKTEFKHQGSFSTNKFVCVVSNSSRTTPPSLEALIKAYGEGVRALCKVSEYKTVKVSRKGDI